MTTTAMPASVVPTDGAATSVAVHSRQSMNASTITTATHIRLNALGARNDTTRLSKSASVAARLRPLTLSTVARATNAPLDVETSVASVSARALHAHRHQYRRLDVLWTMYLKMRKSNKRIETSHRSITD